MGKKTLPCQLAQIDDYTFKITLIQGLNRQIRRMCYKLDYEVLGLKRIRIGDVNLGNLKAGEYRILEML
jgi:23S rRNA pseudouridine2604 synthase